MTGFNIAQLVLAALALALVAERFWVVLFRAKLDTGAYMRGLKARLLEGDVQAALRLAEAGRPAWVAQFAHAMLKAKIAGENVDMASADAWAELREEAGKRLYAIHGLARMASPLALMGVILQLAEGFGEGERLTGLQAGLVESLALERALVTLVLGLATSGVCFVAAGILRKNVRQAMKDLERMSRALGEAFEDSYLPEEGGPDEEGGIQGGP